MSQDRPQLTDREIEVLHELASGLPTSSREIGKRMGIKPYTVKTYLLRIAAKTGWTNRTEMCAWWLRTGQYVYDPPPN